MSGSSLLFNESGIDIPLSEEDVAKIVHIITDYHHVSFELLEIAVVDEQEIIRLNKKFLDREYVTDTISFRYDDEGSDEKIEATIYVCAQRVVEQALELKQVKKDEFLRIVIHGFLHIIGYDDESEKGKEHMRTLEDIHLNNFYKQ